MELNDSWGAGLCRVEMIIGGVAHYLLYMVGVVLKVGQTGWD